QKAHADPCYLIVDIYIMGSADAKGIVAHRRFS
ncbi:MAG: hypothetical protein JWO03_1314, partial [Bacteroidetes bacterium]|nr:hypothetical protein [Bacteroidota bacterium]